jgi:hypothetical protein
MPHFSLPGWQSMLISARYLVRPWLDFGSVDIAAGERADSDVSCLQTTIHLQVLISIQSMILCDEPYLNEPGWANGGGTPQSKACKPLKRCDYVTVLLTPTDSSNVRRMVVRTAVRVLASLDDLCLPAADARERESPSGTVWRCDPHSLSIESPSYLLSVGQVAHYGRRKTNLQRRIQCFW